MKKFLKVFIITILVLAVIVGTCIFFFRKVKENDHTTASIAGELYSQNKAEFNQNLNIVSSFINGDGTDNRLDLLIQTNENLDDIVELLASYYIENDTKINNEQIFKALNRVIASRSLLNSIIEEYYIKITSPYFDRHLGANDFYKEMSNYLVCYAEFAYLINDNLSLDKSTDLKFTMFEVYANVVINTFNQTALTNSRVIVKDSSNINKINQIFVLKNGLIETQVESFGIEINRFIKAYRDCNETEFVKNLSFNISTVTSASQSSNEKIATYYLKQIFKI